VKWQIDKPLTYLTVTRVQNMNIEELTERGISMINKLLIAGAIMTSVLLTGCANNNTKLEQSVGSLSTQVNKLTAQVQQLESEHEGMKSQIESATDAAMQAQEEAQRANSRIDNIAASYSK